MSQFDPVIGADKSGLAYRQDDNSGKKALLTQNKGSTAPSYAEAGALWLDDSATPWVLKLYDGTDWIAFGEFNESSDQFSPYYNGATLAAATTTAPGVVERASDSEASAGTDTTRYITSKQLADNKSSGLVLISEQTASTDTSVEFTGIDDTYEEYELHIVNMTVSSDGADLYMRVSTDGGSSYVSSSDYATLGIRQSTAAATSVDGAGGDGLNQMYIDHGISGTGNDTGESLSVVVKMFNPASSTQYFHTQSMATFVQANNYAHVIRSNWYEDVTAVDAIQIFLSNGNIVSGEFKLYGVQKS